MTPEETVAAFIAAWNDSDIDSVLGMMSETVIWHNIPMEPTVGIAAVTEAVHGFMGGVEACNWETHAIAANGNKVLTERTDNFSLAGGKQAGIRLMGIFEIDGDGKIAEWRDYFDMLEFQREFAG